jgi:hypothetical protein
LRGVS